MNDFQLFINYVFSDLVPDLWSMISGSWFLSLFIIISIFGFIIGLYLNIKNGDQ